MWTDEDYFSLQNRRIWAMSNPREYLSQPLHSTHVTAWCGFTTSFILGPFSIIIWRLLSCTVTAARYLWNIFRRLSDKSQTWSSVALTITRRYSNRFFAVVIYDAHGIHKFRFVCVIFLYKGYKFQDSVCYSYGNSLFFFLTKEQKTSVADTYF